MIWRKVGKFAGISDVHEKPVHDGHLRVIVGQEPAEPGKRLWHISISHSYSLAGPDGRRSAGRIPTWDEIKDARYLFVPDNVNMAMMLPPKRLYINVHPTTMHLWEIPMEHAGGDA